MNKILVAGSIAFDNIMKFPGLFKENIITDKIDALNVSFLVESLKKTRGGTAPNIAYSLSLIGEKPYILGTAGSDFNEYKIWLEDRGVCTDYIRILDNDFTATCFINTDLENNQITSFYPGAMAYDEEISLKDNDYSDFKMLIIAPTNPAAMYKWTKEAKEIALPYMFDPGMQIPRISKKELIEGIMSCEILILNDYELDLMQNKTGLLLNEIRENVKLIVITLGAEGSRLITKEEDIKVKSAAPLKVVDPTGAGDAYRAGLLKGYFEGSSLEKMGKYASTTAVYAVEQNGGMEHKYTVEEFFQRFKKNFS